MSAEDPSSEMLVEVRRFQLRRAPGVELVLTPGGYGRIVSCSWHRISLQDLRYRNTQAGLSSACQTLVRDSLLDSFHPSSPIPRWATAFGFAHRACPGFPVRAKGPAVRLRVDPIYRVTRRIRRRKIKAVACASLSLSYIIVRLILLRGNTLRSSSIVSSKGQIVIPANLRKRYGLKEGTTVVFQEDRGRLVLEPSNYAAIYALQGSLADFPLEEELAKERRAERERENKR